MSTMLQAIGDIYTSQVGGNWRIAVVLVTIAPLLLTYLVTLWNSYPDSRDKNTSLKRPPTLPYVIPWLGHMPSFGMDGQGLLSSGIAKFGPSTPFKLQIPGISQYHVSGPKHVNAFFKTKGMTGNSGTTTALEGSFGMPRSSVAFYEADDSGHLPNSRPGCSAKSNERVMYDIHKLVNTDLSGDSLTSITAQFQKCLAQQFAETDDVNDEWTEIRDLYAFMQEHVMKASIIAMFGTHILSLNPSFMDDFWAWNVHMGPLFLKIPKFLVPSAYRSRAKVLDNIKRWHKFAHENFDCNKTAPKDADWEPYFGSKFSRRRQAMFGKWEQLDDTAKAADDFGFIWAANANAIPAATWFLFELLCDPILKSRIHNEFSLALIAPVDPTQVPIFNVNKLCTGPLCQSIFAETLRLRVQVMVQRKALENVDFCGWKIRKGERVTICSRNEAFDESIWNTGSESNPHPLDEFWADRFLVYPDDPTSGPLKNRLSTKFPTKIKESEGTGEPKFSLEGLSTAWVPFSGAPRLCPGRHFAKQEIISAAAIMLEAFEIELKTKPGWKPGNDKNYFGFGTMPPDAKIPCRIKRRQR